MTYEENGGHDEKATEQKSERLFRRLMRDSDTSINADRTTGREWESHSPVDLARVSVCCQCDRGPGRNQSQRQPLGLCLDQPEKACQRWRPDDCSSYAEHAREEAANHTD